MELQELSLARYSVPLFPYRPHLRSYAIDNLLLLPDHWEVEVLDGVDRQEGTHRSRRCRHGVIGLLQVSRLVLRPVLLIILHLLRVAVAYFCFVLDDAQLYGIVFLFLFAFRPVSILLRLLCFTLGLLVRHRHRRMLLGQRLGHRKVCWPFRQLLVLLLVATY